MEFLERKYADILIDEDITGVHIEKKKKKRTKVRDISYGDSLDKSTGMNSFTTRNKSSETQSSIQNTTAKRITTKETSTKNAETYNIKNDEKTKTIREQLKAKLDSRNKFFDNKIRERQLGPKRDYSQKNLDVISKLNSTAKTGNFCLKREVNDAYPENENVYLYSTQRKNYYANYVDQKRQEYEADKTHYYTFSKDFLTLSFPMVKNKNIEYEDYMQSKSQWKTQEGFNRFSTFTKEKIYFPRKDIEL